MEFNAIRLLVLDVDGVLTDGGVTLSGAEEPSTRTFHVQDGLAIKLWRERGGRAAIISGRSSDAVARRAAELGIEWVRQGISDKIAAYEELLMLAHTDDSSVAYVGDDLPDLPPMLRCALPVAVVNAVPQVKRAAAYVTRRKGGSGCVAEIVEFLLRKQKRWTVA